MDTRYLHHIIAIYIFLKTFTIITVHSHLSFRGGGPLFRPFGPHAPQLLQTPQASLLPPPQFRPNPPHNPLERFDYDTSIHSVGVYGGGATQEEFEGVGPLAGPIHIPPADPEPNNDLIDAGGGGYFLNQPNAFFAQTPLPLLGNDPLSVRDRKGSKPRKNSKGSQPSPPRQPEPSSSFLSHEAPIEENNEEDFNEDDEDEDRRQQEKANQQRPTTSSVTSTTTEGPSTTPASKRRGSSSKSKQSDEKFQTSETTTTELYGRHLQHPSGLDSDEVGLPGEDYHTGGGTVSVSLEDVANMQQQNHHNIPNPGYSSDRRHPTRGDTTININIKRPGSKSHLVAGSGKLTFNGRDEAHQHGQHKHSGFSGHSHFDDDELSDELVRGSGLIRNKHGGRIDMAELLDDQRNEDYYLAPPNGQEWKKEMAERFQTANLGGGATSKYHPMDVTTPLYDGSRNHLQKSRNQHNHNHRHGSNTRSTKHPQYTSTLPPYDISPPTFNGRFQKGHVSSGGVTTAGPLVTMSNMELPNGVLISPGKRGSGPSITSSGRSHNFNYDQATPQMPPIMSANSQQSADRTRGGMKQNGATARHKIHFTFEIPKESFDTQINTAQFDYLTASGSNSSVIHHGGRTQAVPLDDNDFFAAAASKQHSQSVKPPILTSSTTNTTTESSATSLSSYPTTLLPAESTVLPTVVSLTPEVKGFGKKYAYRTRRKRSNSNTGTSTNSSLPTASPVHNVKMDRMGLGPGQFLLGSAQHAQHNMVNSKHRNDQHFAASMIAARATRLNSYPEPDCVKLSPLDEFCADEDQTYPKNEIFRSMWENMQDFYGKYRHFNDSTTQDSSVRPDVDGYSVCSFDEIHFAPTRGRSIDGSWKVIVNMDGHFEQHIDAKKCSSHGKKCLFLPSIFPSTCVQKFTVHHLVTYDTDGKSFSIDAFKIPSVCSCVVQKPGV